LSFIEKVKKTPIFRFLGFVDVYGNLILWDEIMVEN
jgi:hypothetical protein